MNKLTLGSLFSGSGGFELGALMSGITPVWASEIEPFCIMVTSRRLPDVKHYGDITKIDGGKIEPVNIITFGSPCQDLSVAGKRNGLDGSRSCLFHEAVRVIKEMRGATNGNNPRFILWENVPGAFTSNKGEDFKRVIEEIISIRQNIDVPQPSGWAHAGQVMGNDYSVAWRTLDAQFWGVPQRRRRIFLVADLDGPCAPKVLFESEGVSGYSKESFRAWQDSTGRTAESSDITGSLNLYENHGQDSRYTGPLDVSPAVLSTYGTGGNNQPLVTYGLPYAAMNSSLKFGFSYSENIEPTLLAKGPGAVAFPKKAYAMCSKGSNAMKSDNPLSGFYEASKSRCLSSTFSSPTCNQGGMVVVEEPYYIVRKITPAECARLQGFPDWWADNLGIENPADEDISFWKDVFETYRKSVTHGKKSKTENQIRKWLKDPSSDTAEYKMWGNGVALPCVYFVLSGIKYFFEKNT